MGETELGRFKICEEFTVILRDDSGKYIVRGECPNGSSDTWGHGTGIELLAEYFRYRNNTRDVVSEYTVSLYNFMHTHFTEEQWALAVLENL